MNTFIRILGPIPKVKKLHWSMTGEYNCILGTIWAKQGVGEQVWFVPNIVVESGGQSNPRKIL